MGAYNVGYLAGTALVAAGLAVVILVSPPSMAVVAVLVWTCLAWLCASAVFFAANAFLVLGWAVDRTRERRIGEGKSTLAVSALHAVIGCASSTLVILGLVGLALLG